jgi:CHAT domain-containing protein
VIHFACHGVSDSRNPSNSHLVLRKDDGSESGTADKLTVGDISNMNIKQAQIAYLSACSTAENASESLADESIYIASGFQLAGFSHVFATQWVSNDRACMRVAGDFYSSLFRSQPSGSSESHREVSAAFYYAVKKLRDANLSQPILWAPYIHTGA